MRLMHARVGAAERVLTCPLSHALLSEAVLFLVEEYASVSHSASLLQDSSSLWFFHGGPFQPQTFCDFIWGFFGFSQ